MLYNYFILGELCVRSPWVSFPKWDLFAEQPQKAVTGKNGWHFSSDWGSLDKIGKLRLQGRADDIIKSVSEAIVPLDIEKLVIDHPFVRKVCVVGVPDQRLHEKLCACVELAEDKKDGDYGCIENELDRFCSETCFKSTMGLEWKPHCYVFMEELPKTRTGKLNRKLTKEMVLNKLALKY